MRWQDYQQLIKRRRKSRTSQRTSNNRYLLLLLLLAGDVETHPGPQNVSCPRCNQTFDRQSRLDNHLTNQHPTSCQQCNRLFCSENQLKQHQRTEHQEEESRGGDGVSIINLNDTIFPVTHWVSTEGYRECSDSQRTKTMRINNI